MDLYVDILRHVNAGLFTLLTLLAARQWHRRPSPNMVWLTLTFGSLAWITVTGIVFSPDEDSVWAAIVGETVLAMLVLFPWFMYRFTGAFADRSRTAGLFLDALTVVSLGIGLLLRKFSPEEGVITSYLIVFLLVLVAQWISLLGATSFRLWRAGRGQPTIARRRMLFLATGALGMAGAIILIGVNAGTGNESSGADVIVQLCATLSALLFFFGFFTPKWLRLVWRNPEQEKLRESIAELLKVTESEALKERMLPLMARLVAARGIAFVDFNGEVIALHGVGMDDAKNASMKLATAEAREERRQLLLAGRAATDNPVLPMEFDFGILLIWINPYMPFFGSEDFELMRSLGVVFSLALERTQALASQTERAAQETERAQQLEHVSKLKDEFVSMASHELRTPLASILGFSQTLKDMPERFDDAQRATFLNIIHEQGTRLQRLIEDMLTLSRIESGGLKVELQQVNVRDAMDKAVLALSATGVDINCDPQLEVRADPHHLHQVLINYLTNADRYGSAPFHMHAETEADKVHIIVEDEGAGVPAEFVPRMFERFSQASDTGKVGTGLGLSIVKEIASAQGGKVWYEPRPDGGSRFGVTLPAQGPAVVSSPDHDGDDTLAAPDSVDTTGS